MKTKKKRKQFVYVGVWGLPSDDPVVFVGRSQRSLDVQIYDHIKEYFDEVFDGDPVPKKKSEAIGEYFQHCGDRGIDESYLETREEVL